MGKVFITAFFALLLLLPFAAAQSVLSEGAVKFWSTWFYVPVKYLATWQNLVTFAVAPVVIALFFAYEIWKELGIFHSGGANFWIPLLIVYMMLPNGFWGYVDLFVLNVQMIPALVLSFFALQITSKVKGKITSFGYTGIFGGLVGYVLEAVSGGIFLGSIGFMINRGHFGPLVYILASVGTGLGVLLLWWEQHGKKIGNLKNLLGQERLIDEELIMLEKRLAELSKRAIAEKSPAAKTTIEDQMANVKRRIDRLRAQEEVVADQTV